MKSLTDSQIVAHVNEWNTAPEGYPKNHRLYYFDGRAGWWYLTPAGAAIIPDAEMTAQCIAARGRWAEAAVRLVVGGPAQ